MRWRRRELLSSDDLSHEPFDLFLFLSCQHTASLHWLYSLLAAANALTTEFRGERSRSKYKARATLPALLQLLKFASPGVLWTASFTLDLVAFVEVEAHAGIIAFIAPFCPEEFGSACRLLKTIWRRGGDSNHGIAKGMCKLLILHCHPRQIRHSRRAPLHAIARWLHGKRDVLT